MRRGLPGAVAIAIALAAPAARAQTPPDPPPAAPDDDPPDTDDAPPEEQPAAPPAADDDVPIEDADDDRAPVTPDPARSALPDAVDAPSLVLSEYFIEGNRLEKESTIRAFLDQAMPIGQPWTSVQQRDVTSFLADLGYHVGIRDETRGSGSVAAYLNLQPITLVRRIKVDLGAWYTKLSSNLVQDRVFEEDLERRMRLQVGRPLPIDEATRKLRLADEVERLEDYLADEGFFEAEVAVSAVPDGANAVKLEVDVDLGPPYYIGNVRVVGNREVSDDEIQAIFHHRRLKLSFLFNGWRRRFDRAQLKRDIDAVTALYHSRGFPGVRVRTDFDRNTSFKRNRAEVDFTVIVRERRRIEVYFEGHEDKKESKLREQLTLDEEGSYDDFEIQRSAQAIRRYYQSQGYFEASVLWERVSFRIPSQLFDRIVYTIDEGPKLKVRRISFRGNRAVTEARLRDLIKTREYPRFFFVSGGYATSLQLDQDVQRITAAYREAGYADVQVHYEVSRAENLIGSAPGLAAAILGGLPAEGLYVRFIVNEGARQRVSKVEFLFEGPHVKDEAELEARARLSRGSAFTQAAAEADGTAVQRYYFRQGYPYAKVKTEIERDAQQRITVRHFVAEGRPVVFGKVAVRGNFKTREWVIREELALPEGAPFTLGRAETAQRNLRTSGLFTNVRFQYVGLEEGKLDTINVVLNVQERYDYLFDYGFGGGYSTDEKLFAEASSTVPNMWGTGMRLDLRGVLGEQRRSIDGKLLLPRWIQRRWLGLGFRTEASGFYANEDTERFGALTSFGGSLGVALEGQPGGDWDGWFLGARYSFRQRNREEELVRVAGPSDDITRTRVQTRTGSIGPQFVIDKRTDDQGRRNPLSPEAGWRLELSALYADERLFGDDEFAKLGFKGLHYLKLGDRFLITNGVRYDHGIPLGGAVLLPEVERFFAGGDTTVRGFEEDRLLTELVEEDLPPLGGISQFRVLPAGGNIRMIHNMELQVHVWDKSFIAGLPWASALFIDTGLITNSLDDLRYDQFRHSVGIAFWRLVTPVGSFSFEWAVPLDPQIGDNPRGRLHLNLGFVFK
jgi:outer membrane protein insertion porin family